MNLEDARKAMKEGSLSFSDAMAQFTDTNAREALGLPRPPLAHDVLNDAMAHPETLKATFGAAASVMDPEIRRALGLKPYKTLDQLDLEDRSGNVVPEDGKGNEDFDPNQAGVQNEAEADQDEAERRERASYQLSDIIGDAFEDVSWQPSGERLAAMDADFDRNGFGGAGMEFPERGTENFSTAQAGFDNAPSAGPSQPSPFDQSFDSGGSGAPIASRVNLGTTFAQAATTPETSPFEAPGFEPAAPATRVSSGAQFRPA